MNVFGDLEAPYEVESTAQVEFFVQVPNLDALGVTGFGSCQSRALHSMGFCPLADKKIE
jgi:hypothetical protein